MRILLDGRVTGCDGIGRYTRCLTGTLRRLAERRTNLNLRIRVLGPTDTPRYSRAEGEELLAAACVGADLIHVVDFRVPLADAPCPLVVSIHDILRLIAPDHCYSDQAAIARFGAEGMAELEEVTRLLRELRPQPWPAQGRLPRSLHEEYYARMLAVAIRRAAAVITPTRTVRDQLRSWVGEVALVTVSPYGINHKAVEGEVAADDTSLPDRPFMLYVGQARSHKGVGALARGYAWSRARRDGVSLACVGRDFTKDGPGLGPLEDAGVLADTLLLGQVSDRRLSALYQRARALAHLAEHEGFGLTPVEALAHGTRVVASDIPVLRETLGAHATFVARDEPEAVAQALDKVTLTEDSAQAAEECRRWASRYTWERHALDVLDTYVQVLDVGR